MKKILLFLVALLVTSSVIGQVASYTFSQSSGTWTPIAGGTVIATGTQDDGVFTGYPIGFNFYFNGAYYNTFSLNANGWMCMGSAASSSYTPISTGASNNVISAFGQDLQGQLTGEIRYQVLGTTPNQVLVLQFLHWGKYSYSGTGAGDDWSWQFRLSETTNTCSVVYGPFTVNATSTTGQVGLRGASTADFNNRTNPTTWAASAAGAINSASCTMSNTLFPVSGQTYTWTPPPPPPSIVYTPLANTTLTTARTLSTTITSSSGIPTTGIGLPRLYWKIGAGAWNNVAATTPVVGSTYTFTFGAGVIVGDIVSYYICAQDLAGTPIVACSPSAGAAGLTYNPPAAGTPPTPPNTYSVVAGICGTFDVGVGKTYTTLTAAIADLNAKVITCPVTFVLNDATYSTSETFPIIINANAGSSPGNTVTITPKAGVNVTVTSTTATALLKLYGADYIIIDGVNAAGSSLTFNNTYSSGIDLWITSTLTDGATNNTIKNCALIGTSGTTTIAGVLAGSGATLGNPAETPNSYNTIQNNTFKSTQNGMFIYGAATADLNWSITNNTLGSTVAAEKHGFRGVFLGNAASFTVSNNTIVGIQSSATSSATVTGIQVAGLINGGTISANKIGNIAQINSGGWGSNGLFLNSTSTAANLNIFNNLIYDVASYGYSGGAGYADNGYGIMVATGGGYNIYFNSINLNTPQTLAAIVASINISSSITTAASLIITNNIFNVPASNTIGTRYAIYCGAANTVFSDINYNDYYSVGTLGYLGSDMATIAAWRTATGKDVNSLNVDPVFVSGTDLHPTAPALGKAGNYLALIPVDYANAGRTNPPDIGAYQFSANQLLTTNAATAILSTSATLNGTINASSNTVTSGYDYGLTTTYGSSIAGVPATVTGTTVTAFTGAAAGLTANTLYHFRAKGISGGVTVYGGDLTFTTPPNPPTVVTTAATAVLATTATVNGTVNANGNSSTVSFDYGLTTTYGSTIAGVPSPVTGSVVTTVSAGLTGLLPGTLYHYRVKATNAGGTSNGGDLTFTTAPDFPAVVTTAATAITTISATLNGTVNANGASSTVFFDWGLTTTYGNTLGGTPSPVTGTTVTPVSANIAGLVVNTTYHFRVRATNSIGTSNGNDLTFLTVCPIAGPAGPITGPTQVCQGGSGYVYTVTIPNATGYVWTTPVGGTITAGANTNTVTVSYAANAAPGYMFVYGTAACGNGAPSQLGIAVNPPATPTVTGPASVCVNSVGNIYTTQAGMSNYTWTVSAGGAITAGGTTNAITVTWSTTGAKTVTVNYQTAAGCWAIAPTSYAVTVNPLPVPTISGPSPACSNYPGLVYSTQASMTGYTWTISAGGTITSGGTTNTVLVTWNAIGAQSISVNYTNANGCTAAAAVNYPVTVNSGAAPTITGPNTLCVNSGYNNYSTQPGMSGYAWTISAGGVINYGSGTNTITVSWTASGAQWVAVNYTNTGGCSAPTATQFNVTVNPMPGPAGSITGTATVCGGANGVAYSTAVITGAATYVWTLPTGATIASGAGTNAITVNFAGNASSGNITVVGNNMCGNGTASAPFAVTVNALPANAGTITGPASVCQGDAGKVYNVPAISGATGYVWSLPAGAAIVGGSNTNAITVDFDATAASGVITVAGTNSCGSGTVSPNFNLTVNPIPAAAVASNTGYTANSSAAAGNQWYYSVTATGTGAPISGATGQTYDATLTGTGYYWVIVTLNGCPSMESNRVLIITTGVENHAGAGISLYPVPNDGKFTVTFSSNDTYNINVFNNIGIKIYEEKNVEVNASTSKVIDLRPVPNGVYTVIFENNLNQVVKKIVVNK
ncbi:MAG: T9SS type A sorting domain-containing protein [Bacteroidetes bacterium]|nr:T9SS type A sorting domain-containing protein [Bacteroidota bacterium]